MSTTASYIRHGRGRSFNAEAAMASGRVPASYIAKALGKGCTAAFIKAHAPHSGEWHHVGKYAAEVEFYDLDACTAWFATEEARAALVEFKAQAKERELEQPRIADVAITEWHRVAITRFGKLAWRSNLVKLEAVEIKAAGSTMWDIAGYGRKSKEKVVVSFISRDELRARRRKQAAKKAAATRAANKAMQKITVAVHEAITAPRLLCLPARGTARMPLAPLTGGSPMDLLASFARRWAAKGRAAVHPASPEVMAAKAATGMTWSEIQILS